MLKIIFKTYTYTIKQHFPLLKKKKIIKKKIKLITIYSDTQLKNCRLK